MLAISVCLEVEEALLYTTPLPPSTFTPGDTINTHNAKPKQRGFNFAVKKKITHDPFSNAYGRSLESKKREYIYRRRILKIPRTKSLLVSSHIQLALSFHFDKLFLKFNHHFTYWHEIC